MEDLKEQIEDDSDIEENTYFLKLEKCEVMIESPIKEFRPATSIIKAYRRTVSRNPESQLRKSSS